MQLNRPLASVTPSMDADVLVALARVDAALSVSQLHHVVGRYSREGLRKVLARLVQQGIVESEYAGVGVAYRLNRAHLAVDGIIMIVEARSRLFSRIQKSMSTWPVAVRYAVLFGSAARGEMRPDSDIDLLIVHDDDVSHPVWEMLGADLQTSVHQWTGNPLSLISMSTSELNQRADEPLMSDLHRDGVTMRGEREWFDQQTRTGGKGARAQV